MIIRLIDIVLLVLFGFVSVSKLEDQTKVMLPQSSEIPPIPLKVEERLIVSVDILGDLYLPGRFSPSDTSEIAIYLDDEAVKWEGREVRVLIRADRDAPMAAIKRLYRLCKERNIDASLVVVRDEEE
ncbi:biopolymer transporter ExbD [bacterium]|nr:biopolymer transporter ExbD [bacterium]MBU1983861.1 biopolymer transporter ExbD [bacterium]